MYHGPMDTDSVRIYLAGLSLTQFIGYESPEEYCKNTALVIGDIDEDQVLYCDDPFFKAKGCCGEAPGEAVPSMKWGEFWQHTILHLVEEEQQPQTERFFSRRHLHNCFDRGIMQDSWEFPCDVAGEKYWFRAAFGLTKGENGHLEAKVVLMDISRYRSEELAAANLATRDGMTGLYNRVTAQELINEQLEKDPEGPAAVAVIDIDGFKQINDRYGHAHGDRILLNFSDEMQEYFDNDVIISRTGGDEFLLFFPRTTKDEAEEIIAGFAEKEHFGFRDGNEPFYFYASIGYCMFPEQAQDYEGLTVLADEAMYAAKVNRKTHHMFHDREAMPEHRSGMGFSLRELTNSVPAAVLIYRAHGDEEILFANQELIEFFDCVDMDDFMEFTQGSFSTLVHPDDAARTEREIWAQINDPDSERYDYCRYRIRTKTGRVRNIEDYGRLVQTDHYGEVFYVIMHDEDQRDALIAMTKKAGL